VLLGSALLLIPLLLGLLFVMFYHTFTPSHTPPVSTTSITNRLEDASVTNLTDLLALRRDARNEGYATDEIDLRIWAAQALRPAVLFHVQPPETGKRWNWHVSQDGRYAVAVSIGTDALERRQVGLFDLAADTWLWKSTLPWPDTHEAPYVFGGTLVLRYVKNAARFALEITPEGQIKALDKLSARSPALPTSLPPNPHPEYPGTPVASKNGIFFVTDPEHQSLIGFASERLPGLYYAGKGDDNTLFSGNGLLKFTIGAGVITVSDSLTQTVLQKFAAWPSATNTFVSGTLTTHDGSGLNVFLRTEFGGSPAVSREWSIAAATYTGTVLPSFNADALVAKPRRILQAQALSRDSRWQLAVTAANDLLISTAPRNREVARIHLGALLGLSKPISHIAFLEEGRYALLRQGSNFWLLDFDVARGYAGLLARLSASAEAAAAPAVKPLTPPAPGSPEDDPYFVEEPQTALPSPAPFALRAERCADHQSWFYAAALLETCADYSAYDSRAPRVNPLLHAHTYLLSGQRQKARLVCRNALQSLISDSSDYNRMIRYQLQGILFAQP
jgi:hypothetical protein